MHNVNVSPYKKHACVCMTVCSLDTHHTALGTCESSKFDTAGHVVIKVDSSSFVVALDDCIQSLRTDTVTCWSEREKMSDFSLASFLCFYK